jgi:putative ABC transport system substrate-binding protein
LTLERIRPDAVLVVADPFLAGERVRIADEMIKNKLPSIYSYHEHVRAGGLMTYTTNYYDVFHRQGLFIDKIFKGAKPGDLPVQQPTKFELMLNLKTAKALGLEISPAMLALDDIVLGKFPSGWPFNVKVIVGRIMSRTDDRIIVNPSATPEQIITAY